MLHLIRLSQKILLVGYALVSPFIIEISNFISSEFSNGSIKRYLIPPPADFSFQMEGITFLIENQYYITAEKFGNLRSTLYRLDADYLSGLESEEEMADLNPYPNPAS